MNIVVAPDSFKGSLSSVQAADLMKNAVTAVDDDSTVTMKPMADGGEGTMESLLASASGVRVPLTCTGPLGEAIDTTYAITGTDCAIIECARIAGLVQVSPDKRNPDQTTTYGIGEAILHALDSGCTSFILAIGGSATNDGGLGMLQALGMQAWDRNGHQVGLFGRDVHHVQHVRFDTIDSRLAEADIHVASDVDNPLCGARGASAVYGPQKGATEEQINQYDAALDVYADAVEAALGTSWKDDPGAGAAGGLGFALLAIGGQLASGAKLLADAMNLEDVIQSADLVLTGEGQSDEQTLYGKAPGYTATLANKHGVPAILISGSLSGNTDKLHEQFSGFFSIIQQPMSLAMCMEKADELLFDQTKHVVHLVQHFRA
ncbi:glycerate kinase [Lentibacillus halophilus]|uniref:Glycerate kinase n=1 Tax=Lentibacillus halophilus TaxID=295065 RepID=A0ABP3JBW7_9BACI